MKFGQRVSIRNKMGTPEFARGIWGPTRREYRDLIELLIHMSRKYIDNKLAMFKIQIWITAEVTVESQAVVKCKQKLKELEELKEQGKITDEEQYERDTSALKTTMHTNRMNIIAFREVIDGIVWRYLDYNRPILYMLADKQPIDLVLPDEGFMNELHELAEVFLEQDNKAILNDISNFLRLGDVTNIKSDGNIEFIEVKSSKRRGGRIARQRQRMEETVEFFNTGIQELDGRKLVVNDSNIRLRNYLRLLRDSILRARNRGYDSILVGNHLIVEIIDFSKLKSAESAVDYFDSRHKSIKEKWATNKDRLYRGHFIDKLSYARNYVPFTVFPFEDDICADILMGKTWIRFMLNNSEIMRILERNGWKVVSSIFDLSEDEIRKLNPEELAPYTVKKGECTVPIPGPWLGKLSFEMLSPNVLVDDLESLYNAGPSKEDRMYLTNYLEDQSIWN